MACITAGSMQNLAEDLSTSINFSARRLTELKTYLETLLQNVILIPPFCPPYFSSGNAEVSQWNHKL